MELLGENGLLKQTTVAVLERALAEELADHLGYDIGVYPARAWIGWAPQGMQPKRLVTDAASIDLEVPRESAGTPEPPIVRKGQRRFDGIDKIVIGLYADGMSVRDIQGTGAKTALAGGVIGAACGVRAAATYRPPRGRRVCNESIRTWSGQLECSALHCIGGRKPLASPSVLPEIRVRPPEHLMVQG